MWEVASVHTELFEGNWSSTSPELLGRPVPAGPWIGEREAVRREAEKQVQLKVCSGAAETKGEAAMG